MSTDEETEDTTVGQPVLFEGNMVTERAGTVSYSSNATTEAGTVRIYQQPTGPAEITDYGQVRDTSATVGGGTAQAVTRMVFTPPFANRAPGLVLGGSTTLSLSFRTTVTSGGRTINVNSTQTYTVTFAGIEPVTTPAGTFSACRFDQAPRPGDPVTSVWLLVGHGVEVQSTYPPNGGNGGTRRQVTRLLINGQVP